MLSQKPVRIAVDAQGGDQAPAEIVRGVVDFLRLPHSGRLLPGRPESEPEEDAQIILVGDPTLIQAERDILTALGETVAEGRLTIRPTSQVIGMDEHPLEAFRNKRDSSLIVPLEMVRRGEADAAFSAGNTGAMMVAAIQVLDRALPDIRRPTIAALLPHEQGGHYLLVDAGANVDCRPSHLVSFALLGSVYAEKALGLTNPRVGVLANGEEAAKGNELSREVHTLLANLRPQGNSSLDSNLPGLNFIGNIEANHAFEGRADVVVCDGFVGNVLLKGAEGVAHLALKLLANEVKNATEATTRSVLAGALTHLQRQLDYAEVGGAPLLGVNGVAIIAHGRSDRRAIANGLRQAANAARSGYVATVKETLAGMSPSPTTGGAA